MRKNGILFLKIILFLCGFVFLFVFFSKLLILKTGTSSAYANASGFRAEPRNSLDVVLVGSCHVHYNFSPGYLWENYGIPAYNYTAGNEPLAVSLLSVQEIFKRQNPKLIVLDVYGAAYEDTYSSPDMIYSYLQGNFDAHPVSFEKWQAAGKYKNDPALADDLDPAKMPSRLELTFGLLYHKSRIQALTDTDFSYFTDVPSPTKAFYPYPFYPEQAGDVPFNPSHSANAVRNFANEDILREIIDYVHSKGAEILLVSSPYEMSVDEFAFYNRVAEIAAEKNVNYLNFNQIKLYDALKVGPTDFSDFAHFNYRGVQKYTDYLGAYFTKTYALTNQRANPRYHDWNENTLPITQAVMRGDALRMETNASAWLRTLQNPDYVLIVNTQSPETARVLDYLNDETLLLLQELGIKMDLSSESVNKYQAILSDGNPIEESAITCATDLLQSDWIFEKMHIALKSSSKKTGDFASTLIDGNEYGIDRTGFSITVYSKRLQSIVDCGTLRGDTVFRELLA